MTSTFKVAFLSYGFGLNELGLGTYGFYLTSELRKLDIKVDAFTTNAHIKTFGPPLFYLRNAFLHLKDYDVVHSSEGAGFLINHPRMIETYHHDYRQVHDVNNQIFHLIENLQCRKVKQIIVPSIATKDALLRYGFEKDRISFIPHGVDHNVYRKNEALRSLIREKYGFSRFFAVINVGQLIQRKRQIDIVKALEGIPNVVFILVGAGDEENNIKNMANRKGVKLIHFKNVPQNLLIGLYSAADAYVHTSILEGFGLTVIEAMACSLPVIAYETADFRRILNRSGRLLRSGDIKGLRQSIIYLKDDPILRESASKQAHEESKRYSWRTVAVEHLKIYKKVCC